MEPDEGWNVDNLMDMMEDSENAVGGPTTKEVFERPVFNYMDLPGITGNHRTALGSRVRNASAMLTLSQTSLATAPLGFFDPLEFSAGASEGARFPECARFPRRVAAHCTSPVRCAAHAGKWTKPPWPG